MFYVMWVIKSENKHKRKSKREDCQSFGGSLFGEPALPLVERAIQIRELFAAGERGDYLE